MGKEKIKIPLKPLSKGDKQITALLWFISIIFLVLSFLNSSFFITFLISLALYGIIRLQSNIKDAFSKTNFWNGIKYLPISLFIRFLGEFLIEMSGLSFFKIIISVANFGRMIESSGSGSFNIVGLLFSAFLLFLVCIPFNYLEEYYFRDKWYKVAVWCALHLFLGLSIFTIGDFILLAIHGILFKYIYDKHSVQSSFITHLFQNYSTIIISLILSL